MLTSIYLAVNEALKPQFLDLKEGAIVISLAPFVSSLHGRVTERNVRTSWVYAMAACADSAWYS